MPQTNVSFNRPSRKTAKSPSDNRKSIQVGVVGLILFASSACQGLGTGGSSQAGSVRADTFEPALLAQAEQDTRPLEEKVDTDGDGEMSDEEVDSYARRILLDFSACMRDSGFSDFTDVVLEDFTEGGSGQGRFLELMAERGLSFEDPDSVSSLRTCGGELSDLQSFAPQPSDAELVEREEQLLEFAGCMRDQGLQKWPDPDFAANPGSGYGRELLQEFDIQSDEVQDAGAACEAEGSGFAVDESDGQQDQDDDQKDAQNEDVDGATDSNEDPANKSVEAGPRDALSPLIEGDTSNLDTATVTRRDLIQTKTLSATLGFGDQQSLPTNTTGIVTALPTEGDTINFGEALFYVDNEPVLLLEGALPQYRPFSTRMSDGPDVFQLEQSLQEFGWTDGLDLTIDEDFTGVTRDAVKALQEAFGFEDSGKIALGRVVFREEPLRVAVVHVQIGQSISPQVNVLSVSDGEQRIELQIDAEDRSLLEVGKSVLIELPDGSSAPGTVSEVASVATRSVNSQSGGAAEPTIGVTILFDGAVPDNVFDAAPVDIVITDQVTSDVLTIPVTALVARSGGGHAVELIVEGGTQLVAVELGDFVDDLVEVSGDVREGDRVVMASAS